MALAGGIPLEFQADPTSSVEAVASGMKLQWLNPSSQFVDVPVQGLYVQKGTTVTFKAVPVPSNSSWPGGPPTWSGTSGITGTGETATVTFSGSSTSMSDTFSVVATSGAISAGTGVVSWEDIASIEFTLEESASASFYVTVTYRLWTPDYSGSGQPSASGGSANLYMTPSFDGFDGSTPPDLTLYAEWSYSNGVAETKTYTIQTDIHNPPGTAGDVGPSQEVRSPEAPDSQPGLYYAILSAPRKHHRP